MDALDAQVIFLLLVIGLIALFIRSGIHKVGDRTGEGGRTIRAAA